VVDGGEARGLSALAGWLPGPDALTVAAGIAGVLVVATVAGWALRRVAAQGRPHAVIDNVVTRVRSWWVIAAVVGLALLGGRAGVCLLFALASAAALREFVQSAGARSAYRAMVLGAFGIVLPLQYWLVWTGADLWVAVVVPVCAFVVLPALAVSTGGGANLLRRLWLLQWGLMLCVWGVSHVPALLTLTIPGHEGRNGFLLMFLLLVTQLGDVFQYLWGKAAGRHALAPALSPSKTIEGAVGGVLSATGLGAGLSWMTPFTAGWAALLALAVSLLGVLGGLVFSAAKRSRGIKDWGALIPGHGGMLDRLDSLCLSAPFFYYCVGLGWAT
jgi:phosphatidate cytidylyltransferase